jgi:peptidyl-prolyl cis-trans isomerase B (cyclophilin B)
MIKTPSLLVVVTLGAFLVGCNSDTPQASSTTPATTPPVADDSKTNASSYDSTLANSQLGTGSAPASGVEDRKPKTGEEVAVLDTGEGRIVLMFFPDKAPNTVKNFKKLVAKGFYNGTKFHRIIPGFMIQGGDPNTKNQPQDTWGQGGPGYSIDAEFNDIHHGKGILSMARSSDPNSAGSQFFIVVGEAPFLDHQYTAFGKVVTGMEVADKIVNGPKLPAPQNELAASPVAIKKATLQKWPVK